MTHFLQSSYLHFNLDSRRGTWSLNGLHKDSPSVDDVWMQVSYRMGNSALLRRGRRRFSLLDKWNKSQISGLEELVSLHGKLQKITVTLGPDANGIHARLEFALMEQHPLFIWRLTLENEGQYPIQIARIDLLQAGFFPRRRFLPESAPLAWRFRDIQPGFGAVRPHPDPGELAFFSNGWQSWSYTGTYGSEDVYRGTRLGFLAAPMWYAVGKAPRRDPGYFVSELFGLLGDRRHRTGILAGFLSQKQHFGALEASLVNPLSPALSLWVDGDRARLDPGAQMTTDWAAIQFVDIDAPDPLAPYLQAVARENHVQSSGFKVETGWCSWYHFFQDIDEGKMRANLQSAKAIKNSIPLSLFQIDDGFEAQVGDWLDFDPGFPEGVAPLAKEIKAAGFTPGLWLAPFIAHSKSRLNREHRDWLLRNRLGLPVNAGFVWNNFNKALDLTRPQALDYVREVVKTAAHQWGYPYLKLDFVYAAALKGRYHDRTKTRAQVLRMGLEAIREAVGPHVTLLGCGCPLGAGIGIFDAMRIGADVDPRWDPHFAGVELIFRDEPNMPSARNALQNVLTRAALHNRWWVNDPDCLLLRRDSRLTLAEIQSLATAIALSGGSLLLSDDLPEVPPERLQIAGQLLPLIGQRPGVLDWLDEPTPRLVRLDLENLTGKWHLLAVFNWEDEERDATLPMQKFDLDLGSYFVREFWTGESSQISQGLLTLKAIPAHGVKLLALTPQSHSDGRGKPLYLGSDLHISQGLEVIRWAVTPRNRVCFSLERPGDSQGEIELYLPEDPERILVNHQEIQWQTLEDGRYRFQVQFSHWADIEVE